MRNQRTDSGMNLQNEIGSQKGEEQVKAYYSNKQATLFDHPGKVSSSFADDVSLGGGGSGL